MYVYACVCVYLITEGFSFVTVKYIFVLENVKSDITNVVPILFLSFIFAPTIL
jgi:hypothetical protein